MLTEEHADALGQCGVPVQDTVNRLSDMIYPVSQASDIKFNEDCFYHLDGFCSNLCGTCQVLQLLMHSKFGFLIDQLVIGGPGGSWPSPLVYFALRLPNL